MAHAYWTGFLRLSLVSCPIYLSPAITERERVTLHQINPKTHNRIKLQPVDAETGEELDRADLIRGFEAEKGKYIEIEKDELDALKIESSRVLELSRFIERTDINPLYLDTPYYVYPENKQAEEAYHVIAAALAKADRIGLGQIVASQRERPVALQPFENGMILSTLHTADEVRAAEFQAPKKKLDTQMIDIASTIIDRYVGKFDPSVFHDDYQDALRDLIKAKQKGKPLPKQQTFKEPSNVVDLMAVLKKSLDSTNDNRPQKTVKSKAKAATAKPKKSAEAHAKPKRKRA